MKLKISAVISAYNEESKIEACLQSLDFVDEIIVIDSSSTDKTSQIAKRYTSKVFLRSNNIQLNINKNFGFEKAKNEWILNLDGDEKVTGELKEEISKLNLDSKDVDGYLIPRFNIIFGKQIKHGLWYPDYQLRLFRKSKGRFPIKHIHELVAVDGNVKKLNHHLKHNNYESVSQFIRKTNDINTTNEAETLFKQGKKVLPSDFVVEPVGDFFKIFIMQSGYKDGMHGLALSMLMAFYTFLVQVKLWELYKFEDNYTEKEFNSLIKKTSKVVKSESKYWIRSYFIKTSKIPSKLYYRALRKLKI